MIAYLLPVIWIVVGLPLAAGIIPRNRFYGVRTRRTLGNDAHWYRINRICGVLFALVGAAELCVVSTFKLGPMEIPNLIMPIVVVAVVLVIFDRPPRKGDGPHG